MTIAVTATWRGRRGAMLLGPTESRVARYLEHRTSNGRVAIRTTELVAATGVERSEAYRITRRLRILGLFGIEDDRGGRNGGRRYWRTAIEHDGPGLNADRHRAAWSRIVAWGRERRSALLARLEAIRHHTRREDWTPSRPSPSTPAGVVPSAPAGPSFAEAMRRHGLGPLMDSWAKR